MRAWWYPRPPRGSISAIVSSGLVLVLLLTSVTAGSLPGLSPQPDPASVVQKDDWLDAALGSQALDLECAGESTCERGLDWVRWTEQVSLEELERGLEDRLAAAHPGSVTMPRPSEIEGYAQLPEPAKRETWRAWFLVASMEQDLLPGSGADLAESPMAAPAAGTGGGMQEPGASDVDPESVGTRRGLSGIWRLEGHGEPRQMIPAGEDGATFLVTSQGVLYFPAPGASPEWMVRPTGSMGNVETTERPDGVRDLVIGTRPAFQSDQPSLLVVDGQAGEVKFRGFSGGERLLTWTLTGLDDSGTPGLIGLDASGNVVTSDLEGNVVYREPLPGLPSESVVVPGVPVYVALLYLRLGRAPFADLDGDGTKDLFYSSWYFLVAGLVVTGGVPVRGRDECLFRTGPGALVAPVARPRIHVPVCGGGPGRQRGGGRVPEDHLLHV